MDKSGIQESRETKRFRHPLPWMLLALALLAFVPYLPTLQNDFLQAWDDGCYVTQNHRIQNLTPANLIDIFRLHPQRGRMPNAQYTPLVELSYMLEIHFFGLAPRIFHLHNVLLHVFNTLLVFFFVRHLTMKSAWAWLTALFFAVHPLHVESVAWITERKDMLSAFFYLSAAVFYLRYLDGSSRRSYVLALASGIFAFLSKPLAVTLPAILLLCAIYGKSGWNWKTVKPLIPFFALSAVGAFITFYTHFTTTVAKSEEVLALGSNLLVAARGIVFYLEKFIWPFALSAFYPVPELGESFGFDYYAALAAVIALAGLLVWCAVNSRYRTCVFGALFFLIALAPSSRLVPVGLRFLAADRFFYLPGIGFFLLLAYGFWQLLQMRPVVRYSAMALVFGLCLLWSAGTWERSQVWRNDETLWRDTLAKYPDSAYVLGGFAQTLAATDVAAAGSLADKALAVSSSDGQVMLVKAFQCQKNGEFEACFDWLAQAGSRGVNEAHVALMVGRTYSLLGNHAKAIRAYAEVLKTEPQSMEALAWIAVSQLALDDEAAALEALKKMQAVNVSLPENARLLNKTVSIYSLLPPLQQALCLVPDLMRHQYELCQSSQFVLKDKQRARKEYRLLLKHYPLVVDVWRDVANQLPAQQWPAQVFEVRENHIRKLAVAFYNQACLLEARGKSDEALAHLDRAIQYDRSLRRNAIADSDLASLRGHSDFIRITQPSVVSSQIAEHVQAIAGPQAL